MKYHTIGKRRISEDYIMNLDKIAKELVNTGVMETEIKNTEKLEDGIRVTTYTIKFSKNDYQWYTSSKVYK
jgi:hypothetical protein